MTADLDRLELELRSLPGIVAVGLEGDVDGGLLIQTVIVSSMAPADLRDQILQRIVDANVRDGARVEIVLDELDTSVE